MGILGWKNVLNSLHNAKHSTNEFTAEKTDTSLLLIDGNSIIYESLRTFFENSKMFISTTDAGTTEYNFNDESNDDILAQSVTLGGLMTEAIVTSLDTLITTYSPEKTLLAFDGVVPFMKVLQQKRRREALEDTRVVSGGELLFSNKWILPGSKLMALLREAISNKISNAQSSEHWSKVVFSSSEEYGEGEHKLLYMLNKELPNTNKELKYPKAGIRVIANDNDMYMLLGLWLAHRRDSYPQTYNNVLPKVWLLNNHKTTISKNTAGDDEHKQSFYSIGCLLDMVGKDLKNSGVSGGRHRETPAAVSAASSGAAAASAPDEILLNMQWITVMANFVMSCFVLGNDFVPKLFDMSPAKNADFIVTMHKKKNLWFSLTTVAKQDFMHSEVSPFTVANWSNLEAYFKFAQDNYADDIMSVESAEEYRMNRAKELFSKNYLNPADKPELTLAAISCSYLRMYPVILNYYLMSVTFHSTGTEIRPEHRFDPADYYDYTHAPPSLEDLIVGCMILKTCVTTDKPSTEILALRNIHDSTLVAMREHTYLLRQYQKNQPPCMINLKMPIDVHFRFVTPSNVIPPATTSLGLHYSQQQRDFIRGNFSSLSSATVADIDNCKLALIMHSLFLIAPPEHRLPMIDSYLYFGLPRLA